MPRSASPGSRAGHLNRADWWNVGKHLLLVAGASALASLAEQAPGLLTAPGVPVLVPIITSILTLAMRWVQDNR